VPRGPVCERDERPEATPELSLVAPVYNELDNLGPLADQVRAVFGNGDGWELILVDDGSNDGSAARIVELSAADAHIRGIFFERNAGQTAALAAGIDAARGELIATLDADLQNDPADLPAMVDALGDHHAVVGFRLRRQDNWVKRVSSHVANAVRNAISGDDIRDTGCSLKVFRADAIRSLPLFEGLHRFFPTLLRYHGFSVIEHGVSHRPRVAGISKYGVRNRVWRAFKDLLVVRWMRGRLLRLPLDALPRHAAQTPPPKP
jgi:glycosyltransferase involved in cell wall biosynthesis